MKIWIAAASLALFPFTGCGTGPEAAGPPYDPAETASEAIDNFAYAWNARDLVLLDETLSENFEMPLPEELWDDFDGDGVIDTAYPRSNYLTLASNIFSAYSYVELFLDYAEENTEFTGNWDMKAYNMVSGQQEGWLASGETMILCTENGSGEWKIASVTEIPPFDID